MAEDLEMEFIEMARAVDELVDSPPPRKQKKVFLNQFLIRPKQSSFF